MTTTKLSFEEKFAKVLKPSIDKHIDSDITNSMSEEALRRFVDNKKNKVDHLLEMKSMATELD